MTTTTPTRTTSRSDAALAQLHTFTRNILPGTVRRISAWRHLPRQVAREHLHELRQELAVDCLQHAEELAAMTEEQRHLRWMRLADRWIHWQQGPRRVRGSSHLDPDAFVCEPGDAAWRPDDEPLPLVPAELETCRLRNGRSNVSLAARRGADSKHRLLRKLDALAERLGCDHRYLAYWGRRIVEALTGLAADRLQLAGALHCLPRGRRRPDPEARLARIRRLQGFVPVWRGAMHLRRPLRIALRGEPGGQPSPRQLLELALEIEPTAPATWSWLFEACIAEGDVRAAAAALRSARKAAPRRGAAHVLARARLREARGDVPGALAIVARGSRRPGMALLHRVRRAVTGA